MNNSQYRKPLPAISPQHNSDNLKRGGSHTRNSIFNEFGEDFISRRNKRNNLLDRAQATYVTYVSYIG